jgi:hypothetical protein
MEPTKPWRRGPSQAPRSQVDLGRFSKMPRMFFGSGKAAELGSSASILYLALCEHANRHGKNSFKVSDRALASDTGLGSRTICDARKRLVEFKLIECERAPGQSFNYTLFPLSLEWKQLVDRPRQKCQPRALSQSRTKPGSAKFAGGALPHLRKIC